MRRTTGTLTLVATAIALSGAAQAGNMMGYNVTTTTPEQVGVVTIQPTQTLDTTYAQPVVTETVTTQPQVGEIIYNSEPYMPTTTEQTGGYVTSADGTIVYSDGTTTTQ